MKRDRSLLTVAALLAGGNTERLNFYLEFAAKKNGATNRRPLRPSPTWPLRRLAEGHIREAVAKKLFAAELAPEN